MRITRLQCCGVKEISQLAAHPCAEQAMRAFVRERRGMPAAFYLFTATGPYGDDFKAYIEAHKLGIVSTGPSRVNPNSHNKLQYYMWAPSLKNLAQWARARR